MDGDSLNSFNSDENMMNFGRMKIVSRLFPLLPIFLAALGCTGKQDGNPMARMGMPKPEVVTDVVKQDDVQLYIYVTGLLEPYKEVEVRARIAGYLEELFFRSGAIVKEGDRLALIEPRQYKIALDAAEAELKVSIARKSLAKANLDRAKQLIETRTIALEEYQSREAEYDMAVANVALCQTAVEQAKLNLEYTDLRAPITGKTTKNLVDVANYVSPSGPHTVLLSIAQLDPIYVDFAISDRQFADLKARIGFNDAFFENLQAATPAGGNPADATTGSAASDAPSVRNGNGRTQPKQILPALNGNYDKVEKQRIDISLTTGVDVMSADFPLQGHIVALIDNKVNYETGQITLRGEIRNPLLHLNGNEDYMLYPGWICRVRIPYEQVKDAVLIHEEAILTDLDTKYVLVVKEQPVPVLDQNRQPVTDGDGNPLYEVEVDAQGEPVLDAQGNPKRKIDHVILRRDIEVGRLLDTQQRIVLSGLRHGETYVVKGVQRARIGAAVIPVTLEEFNKRRSMEGGQVQTPPEAETPAERASE